MNLDELDICPMVTGNDALTIDMIRKKLNPW